MLPLLVIENLPKVPFEMKIASRNLKDLRRDGLQDSPDGVVESSEAGAVARQLVVGCRDPKYKVGDHVLVKLSGGKIVEAEVKAVVEKSNLNVLSHCSSLALRTS